MAAPRAKAVNGRHHKDFPPSNVYAEEGLIASLWTLPKAIGNAKVARVRPGDFLDPAYRVIFRHLVAAHLAGMSPEHVVARMKAAGELSDDVKKAIPKIAGVAVSGSGADDFADIVREESERRKLSEISQQLTERIQNPKNHSTSDIRAFLTDALESMTGPSDEDADVETIGQLLRTHKELRRPVLHGLLREGETLNLVAPPKTGKSWLVYQLLLCMVTGRRFMGYLPEPGKVLLIDNELHKETLAYRIPISANALGIETDEYEGNLPIKSLRGKWRDIYGIGRWLLAKFKPGELKVVVVDSWYRALPKGTNENDPGALAEIYNYVDTVADRLGCAFVNIHHSTKGNQTAKSITDVGSGSGVQSRAADTHIALRQHENDGLYVLDGVVRSWAPIDPVCVRFDWPLWSLEEHVDPSQLKRTPPSRASGKPNRLSGIIDKIRDALSTPTTKNALKAVVGANGTEINDAIQILVEAGDAEPCEVVTKGGKYPGFCRINHKVGKVG